MEAVGERFRDLKIKSLVQEIRVIAICDQRYVRGSKRAGNLEEGAQEVELVVDSLRRPLPIPYNEEQ